MMEEWERHLEQLREEITLREDELEFLHEIDLRLMQSRRPLRETFDFIVQRTQELLKSDLTAILLRRGPRLETAYGTDEAILGQHLPVKASITGDALLSGKIVNIRDVTRRPYATKYVPIQGYSGAPLRSLLATPIQVHQVMVGVLSTESTRAGAFKSVHERTIAAIGGQVAIALQRAQLFDQNELFSQVDELIFASPQTQHVIPAALQKVMDALQVLEHVQLSTADIMFLRGEDELEVVHSTNPADVGLVIPITGSVCGRAVRERQTITVGNVHAEPSYRSLIGSSAKSEIAIPLLVADSAIAIGVLNVESEETDAFEGFCQVVLENFAEKVWMLLAFAKLRADVTETMNLRNASDVLVAIGDQASNMIHRMNNTVGAMRLRIIELQELAQEGALDNNDLVVESLVALKNLADKTLMMPDEVTRLLNQQGVTVDINEVVRHELQKFDIPDNVHLEVDLDPDVSPISLYSFDIVVQNLLQNSLDAMPEGGILSISTLSVFQPELASGYLELTVKDTGNGIASEVLPRIFDLNFSTKHVKGKGHGLGLWWIRNFVLRAKGDITVSNAGSGRGAQFTVKIPIDHSPDDR